jgi:lactoylglutathione lyase
MPTRLNHTMLRIRDPKASLAFYRDHLGMELIRQRDFEEAKFSLYFLSFPGTSTEEGILELTPLRRFDAIQEDFLFKWAVFQCLSSGRQGKGP